MDYKTWKAKYVDKVGDTASESQNKNENNPANVNWDVVNSSEYRKKFEGISDNPETDDVIYKKAIEILIHRGGGDYEDMYLFDPAPKALNKVAGSQQRNLV